MAEDPTNMQKDATVSQPEKKKKRRIIWILLAIILIIIIVLLLLFRGCSTSDVYDDAIPIGTEEDYQKRVNDAVAEGMMNVNYSPTAQVSSDGIHSASFLVKNDPGNHYPIQFTIYDENGKEIYESGQIPVGYQLDKITLKEPLSAGTHKCNIEIGYVESGNVTSVFPITIEVE